VRRRLSVTTYRGAYDAATHAITYNVTHGDSADPKFTYTQVTAYRSAAEFIAEVRVLAPLTLSVSTRARVGYPSCSRTSTTRSGG
jgi:hypothetical protein